MNVASTLEFQTSASKDFRAFLLHEKAKQLVVLKHRQWPPESKFNSQSPLHSVVGEIQPKQLSCCQSQSPHRPPIF
nr:unnamed protein product [Spirometra erinaceieuropaei]